jgi:hypothetical protein
MSNNIICARTEPATTEATATKALQRRFYYGVGRKFLGWQIADEFLQDDGTLKKAGKDGWRHWNVPIEETPRRRWQPFYQHLKGWHRGVVSIGCTHVPFISADFDRHAESVDPDDHIRRVLKAGRLLEAAFPQLCWVAEINPRNGSMKYFGFGYGPIPISTAENFATQIHYLLLGNGCGALNKKGKQEIEVFPHNCVQVGLPMRTDKVTVVATGVLPTCIRRRKNSDQVFENFETHSALAFLGSLRDGTSYDEATLLNELNKGCANLPFVSSIKASCPVIPIRVEQPEMVVISTDAPLGPIVTRVIPRPINNISIAKGDYSSDPNSYLRQLGAMLELCRRLKRVATVEEGLNFIQMNGLFSGNWSENESRREHRVQYLLNGIALTFDPTKCCGTANRPGASSPINIGKYDNWARSFMSKVTGTRTRVDEYGTVFETKSVSVDWRWISAFLSVVEHCCVTCPNEDGSLPQHWAEFIWRSLNETGVISLKWDDRKWKVSRDWLEKRGVIKIVDRSWQYRQGDGKAMIWAVGMEFDRLHVWWKRVKESSGNPTVPLEEFLKNMLHYPSLKAYPHTADSKTDSGRYESHKSASRSPL